MDREAQYRAKADEFTARAANAPSEEQRRELELLAKSWRELADQAARDKRRGV